MRLPDGCRWLERRVATGSHSGEEWAGGSGTHLELRVGRRRRRAQAGVGRWRAADGRRARRARRARCGDKWWDMSQRTVRSSTCSTAACIHTGEWRGRVRRVRAHLRSLVSSHRRARHHAPSCRTFDTSEKVRLSIEYFLSERKTRKWHDAKI